MTLEPALSDLEDRSLGRWSDEPFPRECGVQGHRAEAVAQGRIILV